MRLKNKVALITGGAGGLGEATAKLFADQGATVLAVDMVPLKYSYDNVIGYTLDVTNREDIKKFIEDIKDYKIDILVNNAGITRDAIFTKMTDDMWDKVIDVNLNGIYNLTKYIGPQMMANGKGSIINISSIVGEFGNIGQANYAATKSALYGLTKTWAKEFARKGANVRVNSVSPGFILTEIVKTVPEEMLKQFEKLTMLGRVGEPEEIANVILFLGSDDSSYITGQNISANGGMRI